MTVETVTGVARSFLAAEAPSVLALKGSWGVGKTFAWNKLVHEAKGEIRPGSYAYVSLFGVSSLSELRLAIFANAQPATLIGQSLSEASGSKEQLALMLARAKSWLPKLRNRDVGYLRHVSIGLDALAPHLIKNTLICLDDFERLSDQIKPDELLGFISALKEEKGCKVVLIFNEDELGERKSVYQRYREKVVDAELLFAPTPHEAAELAFPADLPLRAEAIERAVSLRLTNIRVLRRIAGALQLIHPHVLSLHPEVMRQAMTTLVFGAASYFAPSEGVPSLEFLRTWNGFNWGFRSAQNKLEPNEQAWDAAMQAYGMNGVDELDQAVLNIVERGYVEESGLEAAAAEMDARLRASDIESSFSDAWDLFHNTFDNNQEQLVAKLVTSLKTSAKHVSPINLNGTARLLRELGRADLAEEITDYYVTARASEEGLFSLDRSGFGDKVDDAYVRKRFAEQIAKTQKPPTLLEAVRQIASGSWSPAHTTALASATVADFYQLFKNNEHGDDLNRVVTACLNHSAEKHPQIGQNARAALERIGKESAVNAIRVKRYGLAVESDA